MTDRGILDRAERAAASVDLPDDRYGDLLRRRDRGHRRQRIRAGVVGLAVFVVAIWIVASGGPLDRTQTPAVPGGTETTGPTVTGPADPDASERVGVIGLPPEGYMPSTPERGELVVHFYGGVAMGFPLTELFVYEDGRVIWDYVVGDRLPTAASGFSTGWIEQRLTPEGVELLRSEVISTGLFDRNHLDLDVDIGVGPCGQPSGIEVRNGDRLVRLTYVAREMCGQMVRGPHPATPEQTAAIALLDWRLADPASWLPEHAWRDQEIRAYVPARYAICGGPPEVTTPEIVDQLPGHVKALIHADGTVIRTGWGPCYEVTTDQARGIVRALEDAGIEREPRDGFDYFFDGGSSHFLISFQPILPHGEMPT
jgi:hypothetical protein